MTRALEALGAYVRRVGFDGALRPTVWYSQRAFVALDPNTRKHLELTRALGANAKATLFATVDRTRTAMGARMLGRWLLAPRGGRAAQGGTLPDRRRRGTSGTGARCGVIWFRCARRLRSSIRSATYSRSRPLRRSRRASAISTRCGAISCGCCATSCRRRSPTAA